MCRKIVKARMASGRDPGLKHEVLLEISRLDRGGLVLKRPAAYFCRARVDQNSTAPISGATPLMGTE